MRSSDRHRRRAAVAALAAALGVPATATAASPRVLEPFPAAPSCAPPVVARPVAADLSPPLSLLGEAPGRSVGRHRRRPAPPPNAGLEIWPAPGGTAATRGGVGATVLAPRPTFSTDGFVDGVNPADPTGDVSRRHYLHLSNGGMQVWSKDGRLLYGNEYLATLWAGFGGACEQQVGDPYVLWDSMADRWLVTAMGGNSATGPFLQCVALSATADPLGSWHRWAWQFDRLNDFPKAGVWPGGYVLTFYSAPPPLTIVVLDRESLLAGDPEAPLVQLDVDRGTWGVHTLVAPADLDGRRRPPAGSPPPVLGLRYDPAAGVDLLDVFELDVDWARPEAAAIRRVAVVRLEPSLLYRFGPYHRVTYRNFGAFESLVTAAMAYPPDDLALEWYHLRRRKGQGWTLFQHGSVDSDPGLLWKGSAAPDGAGGIGLVWQHSGPFVETPAEVIAELRYTGRTATDPAGMVRAPRTLVTGTHPDGGRFGDYTSIVVDPVNDCRFWVTGQYKAGVLQTNTRIATFRLPGCPDRVPPETRIVEKPRETGAGGTATFTFTSSEAASVFDCALDGKAFAPCASPLALRGLAAGGHELRVRAIDSAGRVDPTPATWRWAVR